MEIVLQVPVSPTLVTCSVTLEVRYGDYVDHSDDNDDHFDDNDDHFDDNDDHFDGYDDHFYEFDDFVIALGIIMITEIV